MADGPLFDEIEEVVRPVAAAARIFKVGELAAAVKGRLEGEFGRVVVEGEVCNAKLHSSGHFYFDLKDGEAVLNGVAWRSSVARWGGVPANGALVQASGKLTTYAQRSTYQLMVERVQLAGIGALMKQLEELKAKLAAEGLFAEVRKKEIPFLPRRIGIVTSPTGAVISDMLHRIEDRCPREVLLWPVSVQGVSAAGEVAAAVAGFNRMPEDKRPDVLIVARGGGSLEDLMAFNSEAVVRAIAASGIPVISGVGHEPDVTLCDLVADVRAPTPSAAAEMVVPVRDELMYGLGQSARRMEQSMRGILGEMGERVENLRRLLPDPRRQVLQGGQRVAELEERMVHAASARVRAVREAVENMGRVLAAHDPMAPLGRGFVFLTREGEMVRSAEVAAGPVEIHFKDGIRKGDVL